MVEQFKHQYLGVYLTLHPPLITIEVQPLTVTFKSQFPIDQCEKGIKLFLQCNASSLIDQS